VEKISASDGASSLGHSVDVGVKAVLTVISRASKFEACEIRFGLSFRHQNMHSPEHGCHTVGSTS
jgi:hypothetical protein